MASAWLEQFFDRVDTDKPARRSEADVNKYASMDELIRECKARGYHAARVGDQVVIFRQPIDVLC